MAARRRSHRLRRLIITVLVLVGLFVAADRITLAVAENTAATNLQQSQHLPARPDIDVHGFPFLNQLATGDYDEITATADDVPIGRGRATLDLAHLAVTLRDVHVSDNFSRYEVGSATATATASYAALGNLVGVDLAYAGGGRVRASKTIFDQRVTVTAAPRLVDGALAFTQTSVNGLADLAESVADAASDLFDTPLPLDGIPFDVRATALTAGPGGLVLTLAGSNLTYTSS